LDKVVDGMFDFDVLGHKEAGFFGDGFLLLVDELVEGQWLAVGDEVDELDFGDGFEVVFDTVVDDIVDGDDELLELVETLVDVL